MSAAPASANGRFPAPTGVYPPVDPTSTDLWTTSTFGYFISHNQGGTFSWQSETVEGLGGPYDPVVQELPGQIILSTTFTGVAVSVDRGCDFTHPANALAAAWVSDLEVEPGTTTLEATTQTTGGVTNGVYQSTDSGQTFTSLLTNTNEYFKAVRFAPSNVSRMYVSSTAVVSSGGTNVFTPRVWVTSDGGATWTMNSASYLGIPDTLVMAVNPRNPDEAYMRTDEGSATPDGGYLYYVLKTIDAGATWTPILSISEKANGIALSPDGSRLYVATAMGGLRVSTDDGATWSPPSTTGPHLLCLTAYPGGLYACGNNWTDGWAFGRSTDGGQTWTGLLKFSQMGPPDPTCPPTSATHTVGDGEWTGIAPNFGLVDAGVAPPAPRPHGCSIEGWAPRDDDTVLWAAVLLMGALALARARRARARTSR
jgi:photosystem II stability/assembly factor-like uncharacterized protein